MIHSRLKCSIILIVLLATCIAGCGGGDISNGSSTGIINLNLTDTSMDTASHVIEEFTTLLGM